MKLEQKKQLFEIQVSSINDTNDPTKKEVEFILHDFDVSHNYAFITKETALKSLETLNGKPIVCKYYPVSEPGAKDDALGSHEMQLEEDRENGEALVTLDTIPIGVFTDSAYIETIDVDGEQKEVVKGKGILWSSRFSNIVGLLKEWVDEGVPVTSSMEILYDSYKVNDGITEILSYVYEGHCLLNSEERGEHKKIYPAYDVSKLTKMVAEAIHQTNKESYKEANSMPEKFKKVFELSHGDVRSKLYQALDAHLGEGFYTWIIDSYDDKFIVNVESADEYKNYQYNYTKNEDDSVSIDFDSKAEVVEERKWVALEKVVELQNELNTLQETFESTKTKLDETTTSLESLKAEKKEVEDKFNEAAETITSLNSVVEELKPFKQKVDDENFAKALSERTESYKGKFEAVNASNEFGSEEVQNLIKLSLNETEEGRNAVYQLNARLVDLVLPKVVKEEPVIREMSSKREDLIPAKDDFDSRYGA